MIKKLLIFSLGFQFLFSCTFFEKEKGESTRYRDIVVVNTDVDKQAINALSIDECLPVEITKSGLCMVTDTGSAKVFLRANATLIELFSDSISPVASLKFCYAYLDKAYTVIKFHKANFSDQSAMLTIYIKNDSFQFKTLQNKKC